ncbi:MAG: signal peptidase I [Victivallaceae bacterium]|nr:signal peptidase I [Victivallaceae bacterium]
MKPTLKSGDAFTLKHYDYKTELRVGDIIVYPHPENPVDVVHRVIKIKPDGVITRGDNNSKVDPYLIKFADIRGVVTAVRRGSKTIHLSGGTRGIIRHKLMLTRRLFMPYLTYPFSVISSLLAASRIFNFVHPFLKIKIIMVERNEHTEEIIQVKNKVVGKRLSKNETWEIKFPYKLFINNEKLQ